MARTGQVVGKLAADQAGAEDRDARRRLRDRRNFFAKNCIIVYVIYRQHLVGRPEPVGKMRGQGCCVVTLMLK